MPQENFMPVYRSPPEPRPLGLLEILAGWRHRSGG